METLLWIVGNVLDLIWYLIVVLGFLVEGYWILYRCATEEEQKKFPFARWLSE